MGVSSRDAAPQRCAARREWRSWWLRLGAYDMDDSDLVREGSVSEVSRKCLGAYDMDDSDLLAELEELESEDLESQEKR